MNQHAEKPARASSGFGRRLLLLILQYLFRLLYHQFAWTYDWVASFVSAGNWRYWVLSIMPDLEVWTTLEIGFGPGHLQAALHNKGIVAMGLDESPQMVRACKGRLLRSGFQPRLIRGLAQALPFASESIPQLVTTFPSEFIFSPETLSEIHRVVAKGGKVVLVPLAWITGKNPWQRFIAWFNRTTGEAPEWDESALAPLRQSGFNVSWEMIQLHSSKLLVIRMLKPASS